VISLVSWKSPSLLKLPNASNEQIADISPLSSKFNQDISALNSELINPTKANTTNSHAQLDESVRYALAQDIEHKMKSQQWYQDADLSLSMMANKLQISTHHLSEVLNHSLGQNFYQYINTYRINWICEQLKHTPNAKLLDLSIAAGFRSKSTFNSVFKKIKHQTPSQFKAQL